MAVTIFQGKALLENGFSFSPVGDREASRSVAGGDGRGVLHWNHSMPTKNPSTSLGAGIIPGQRVTKEKLQRAKELRQNMTSATPSAPIGAPPPNTTS